MTRDFSALFLPLLKMIFPRGITSAKLLEDWGIRCPLRALEDRVFPWQPPLSSGLSCLHTGWTTQGHGESLQEKQAPTSTSWSPGDLIQISSICAPKSHLLVMSLPLTFVLSTDTEIDVHPIHHSPLGEPWLPKTLADIWKNHSLWPFHIPYLGSSVIVRNTNSISSGMLSWLTVFITAQVYSSDHLFQSLRDASGLFPLLPIDGPQLAVNHTPKVSGGVTRILMIFFFCLPKSIVVEFPLSEIETVLGRRRYLVCPMSKVCTQYKSRTSSACQMVQPASSKVPGSMDTMV